jgi:hypothetical protein
MKNAQNATMEFEMELDKILLNIRQCAENQFKYALKNNVGKISGSTFDNVAADSIETGVVNAIGKFIEWDIDAARLWAHHILEDNNDATVAEKFHEQFIKA